jgi:hypothetical protein
MGEISLISIVIYLLLGGIALLFFFALWQQGQFRKFVTGAILCEFETQTGQIIHRVLPTDGKQVLPPQGKWLKKAEKKGKFTVPKDWHYMLPDHMPTVKYPLGGWPMFLKVDVRYVRYVEGNPNPEVFDNKLPAMDTECLTALQNMAVIKMLFNELLKAAEDSLKNKQSQILLYVGIGGIVAGLASSIIGYMVYSKLGTITELLHRLVGG